MKEPTPSVDTKCVVCGKPIFPLRYGEKYGFSKTKKRKILFFHGLCYENLKKKG